MNIDLPILFEPVSDNYMSDDLRQIIGAEPVVEEMRFYNIDAISPYLHNKKQSLVIVGSISYITTIPYKTLKTYIENAG